MSKRGKDGDYKVGRGKPPVEHRFPKGRSGNLNGRPKKVRCEVLDPEDPGVNDLVLSVGRRAMTGMKDGKPVTFSATEAVLMKMLETAMKGNSYAGRSFVQFVANAEAQKAKFKQEERLAAITIKMHLDLERERWMGLGKDEMRMDLHPSDIEIGPDGVKNYLAFTADAREARAKLVRLRDYTLDLLARSSRAAAAGDDDALLQLQRDIAQRLISTINEQLPPRFRRAPPGNDQSLTLGSSPQAVWASLARAVTDHIFTPVGSDGASSAGSGSPNSAPGCGASGARPAAGTTAGGRRRATNQDAPDEPD